MYQLGTYELLLSVFGGSCLIESKRHNTAEVAGLLSGISTALDFIDHNIIVYCIYVCNVLINAGLVFCISLTSPLVETYISMTFYDSLGCCTFIISYHC